MAAEAKIVLSAVDQTKAAIESAKRNLTSLGERAGALPARFGTIGTAIAAAFTAVTLKGAINTLDQLDDLSEKTGIAVDSLSALRYAGEVVGTPLEAIATGVKKLSMNMAEAASGNKEAEATFRSMGITVRDQQGGLKSQDALLLELADKFAGYEDGAGKAALAQKIFGKSGADMIPLLNQGSDGIRRLRGEAEGLGVVYGGNLAKQAATFNDNLKKLELNAEAAKVSLAGEFLPTLNDLIETFIRLKSAGLVWVALGDWIKNVMQYIPGLNGLVAVMNLMGKGPKLTGDNAADLQNLGAERDALLQRAQDAEAFAKRVNSQRYVSGYDKTLAQNRLNDAKSYRMEAAGIDDLREVAAQRQAAAALKGNGETGDAMSRRMQRAKTQAPTPRDRSGDQKASETYLAGLAKEYSNLAGTATKYDEVQEHLRINQDKFSASDRAKALGIAKQIDAWSSAKRAAESNAEALNAQTAAMERMDDVQGSSSASIIAESRALDDQREALGLTEEQVGKLTMQKRLQVEIDKVQIEVTDQLTRGQISQAEAMRRVEAVTALANRTLAKFSDLQAEVEARRRDASIGTSEALRKYSEDIARQGDAAEEATTRSLHGIEDALVDMTTTGKVNVKSLVDMMIAEFMRLKVVRPMMAGLFGNGSMGAGALGGIFGGGGMGGVQAAFSQTSLGSSGFGTGLAYGNMDLGAFFADGGDHTGGLRVVGERGPELEATGASRIFSAEQTRRILSGGSSQAPSVQNITNNYGSGVSRSEVLAAGQMVRTQTLRDVYEARRRGKLN